MTTIPIPLCENCRAGFRHLCVEPACAFFMARCDCKAGVRRYEYLVPDGKRLRRWREKRDLTQGEVATALGVCQQLVSAWERGERAPSGLLLRELFDKEIHEELEMS